MTQTEPKLYAPEKLLDFAKRKLHADNDSQLAKILEVNQSVICKVRYHKQPLSSFLIVKIQEKSGMSLADVREVMGDKRLHQRKRSYTTSLKNDDRDR